MYKRAHLDCHQLHWINLSLLFSCVAESFAKRKTVWKQTKIVTESDFKVIVTIICVINHNEIFQESLDAFTELKAAYWSARWTFSNLCSLFSTLFKSALSALRLKKSRMLMTSVIVLNLTFVECVELNIAIVDRKEWEIMSSVL